MGLENRSEGKYITILNGKFTIRVNENTEGAIARINKLGKQVFELYYDRFTGILKNIKTTDGEYGKSWVFVFDVDGETFSLQLSYSNSFATAFLKMLPNIDLSKPMTLTPSVKEVDGKNKSSLFINQDGVAIKHAYTMENPNGLPDMEQIKIKGQLQWDDTKRLEFLEAMIIKDIMPKLGKTLEKVEFGPKEEGKDSLDEFVDAMKQPNPEDEPF